MKRDHLVRLHDMLDNIDAVGEMIEGMDFAAFRSDLRTSRAVERCIEIISEASRRVGEDAKALHIEIPWPEIAAVGNLMRHEYQRVDSYLIWKIATRSLPELRMAVRDLIARGERERNQP